MQGQSQRRTIAPAVPNAGEAKRFAIYAGDGLYLRSLARGEGGRISFGRDQARSYAREAAIAALHVVRRAGRGAWLVPHPGRLEKNSKRVSAAGEVVAA